LGTVQPRPFAAAQRRSTLQHPGSIAKRCAM
jgi:hypothetical protein